MANTRDIRFLRKRKLLMVLPFLTVPFITLAFWAMGGGQRSDQANVINHLGLNPRLPEPRPEDLSGENKLSFYNKAQEDSIRLRREMQNDPSYNIGEDSGIIHTQPFQPNFHPGIKSSLGHSKGRVEDKEAQIYSQLDALNKAIHSSPKENGRKETVGEENDSNTSNVFATEIDRLEQMMQSVTEKSTEDPEVKKLDGILEKILDIQHPERIKSELLKKSTENKTHVYPVSATHRDITVSDLSANTIAVAAENPNGFFGENVNSSAVGNSISAIPAVIHESETVTSGSVIKLRLLRDTVVNGKLIPKGNFVYGKSNLEGERLLITVPSIHFQDYLLPVSLSVYDRDGLPGVSVPGSMSRDVLKQSADQSLQTIELMSMDPSLKAQATSAGIQTVKGLLSKKVKAVKIHLKAGYQVLPKDVNQQND